MVFAPASIQTTFPLKGAARRLRTLCLRISYFFLPAFSLPSAPPSLPPSSHSPSFRSIRWRACREEIWRCHRCGGKRRFPPRHGGVRFATWLHLPRFQTTSREKQSKSLPERLIHSCANLTFPFGYVATFEISNYGKEVKSISGTWVRQNHRRVRRVVHIIG